MGPTGSLTLSRRCGTRKLVSLYYADTSAMTKLLAEGNPFQSFAAFYHANADAKWISSALLRVEVTRALTAMPALLPDARFAARPLHHRH